ncbi:hypothetical protein AAULR_14349, partial [Lacticaseibacillus rhamnosus MTCC 5462]
HGRRWSLQLDQIDIIDNGRQQLPLLGSVLMTFRN